MHKESFFSARRSYLLGLAGLIALGAGFTAPVNADQDTLKQPALVGQYFMTDDVIGLAGGALLHRDCTHEGSLSMAMKRGPAVIGYLFTPTYWVNNPDPSLIPYSNWPVPADLLEENRLFLCYTQKSLNTNIESEFCDWLPRDAKRPVKFDITNDGVPDIMASIDYHGGSKLCADE